MFKKIVLTLLVGVLLIGAPSAFAADARSGLQTSAVAETNTSLLLPAGTWIYGVVLYADASNSFASVYNSATHQAGSSSNVKCEIGEATQYDDTERWFPKPIYCGNGVSVQITTGAVQVYYGPAPGDAI